VNDYSCKPEVDHAARFLRHFYTPQALPYYEEPDCGLTHDDPDRSGPR